MCYEQLNQLKKFSSQEIPNNLNQIDMEDYETQLNEAEDKIINQAKQIEKLKSENEKLRKDKSFYSEQWEKQSKETNL